MKTIGLIGGMSWESSAEYYRLINEAVKRRLGGLHSAKSLMFSVDFAEIEELQQSGRWDTATERMVEAAQRLERGGADFVVLCTNTMHRMADGVASAVAIPLLHIVDATAEHIHSHGFNAVGLLGTRYTMEQDFYRGRLSARHGLDVVVPDEPDRTMVHDVIYDELCVGRVDRSSREAYRAVMEELADRGAEAIILGCTEVTLLVRADDAPVPVFDTTRIHAEKAVERALA